VLATRVPGLPEGTRLFGYLPMSSHVRLRPEHVSEHGFHEGSAHRRELSGVYQRYQRVSPQEEALEDLQAILGPLFGTGFLLDAWLAEEGLFGAKQVVFSSASSKTALAAASQLSRRPGRDFEVVALTSARHQGFCERVGYYDRVVEYDALGELAAETPTVFVDLAGDAGLLRAVHEHFGPALRYSCQIGLTHGAGSLPGAEGLPGPSPVLFFAPAHAETQQKRKGPAVLGQELRAAQQDFFASARSWLQIERRSGRAQIEAAWREALAGGVDPARGVVLST
jgi:hypothetical protein